MLADAIGGRLPGSLRLRAVAAGDDGAVRALLGSTLPPALAGGPLLALQVAAQRAGFASAFPDGEELLVLRGEDRIGRLWVTLEPGALRVVDLVVAPAHRGHGVGRDLVRAVQASAAEDGLAVRLRVAADAEAAARLYAREGFVADPGEQEDPVRRALTWSAGPS